MLSTEAKENMVTLSMKNKKAQTYPVQWWSLGKVEK